MNHYLNLLFLSFLLLFPLGTLGEGKITTGGESSEIQPAEDENFRTVPSGRATLFLLYSYGEGNVNYETSSGSEDPIDENDKLAYRKASSFTTFFPTGLLPFKTIEGGFTGILLIFPFHFFL